jgi:hypothetical protein
MRTRTTVRAAVIGLVATCGLVLSACQPSSTADKTAQSESDSQQASYTKLVHDAPAQDVTYPMTRNNINFYTDTWNKPGAFAYTYVGFPDSDGVFHASIYYVTLGLPTSMCTALTPPYVYRDIDGDGYGDKVQVPAPGVDGVYYSGGDCDWYYGKDANTGAFVMYHVPMTALVQQFSQPATGESFNHAIRGH